MDTAAFVQPLFDALVQGAGLVIIAVIGMVVNKYVTNVNARQAITQAVDTGANLALSHGQAAGDQFLQRQHIAQPAVQAALIYVTSEVPIAMKVFGLSPADIEQKIEAAIAGKLSVATPIPPPVLDHTTAPASGGPVLVDGLPMGPEPNVHQPTA